jgi:beta-glucosidase
MSRQSVTRGNLTNHQQHELYVWPFAEAVRAGTGSIMCSYNQINNSYACQNSHLQNYILKNELGFQGFIMSDWSAQHSGVSSALAGLDMTMPGDVGFDSATSYWVRYLSFTKLDPLVDIRIGTQPHRFRPQRHSSSVPP